MKLRKSGRTAPAAPLGNATPSPDAGGESLGGGAGALVLGRLVVAALGWAGTVLIVRRLTPSDWGGFSLIFGLLGIVGVLGELRISRLVVRELISCRDPGTVMRPFITLRLFLGLGAYAIGVTVVLLGGFPRDVIVGTLVAGLALLIASVGTAIDLFLTSRMWMRPIAVASVLGQLMQFLATVALFVGNADTIVAFAVPAVLFEVVAVAWRVRIVRGMFLLRPAVDLRRWWSWLRESVPLALGVALTIVYLQIDLLMVGKMDSLAAAGQYAIGYKFAGLVRYVPDAVGAAVLSAMTRSWPEDAAGFRLAFRQGMMLLTLAACLIAAEFLLFAEPAIVLLYGERYSEAYLATQGLILGEILAFYSSMCFATLVSVRRNAAYPVAALVGVVINVGLNLVFIPRWSYNGAALATVITQAVVLLIMARAASRVPGLGPLPGTAMFKALLAGAGAVAAGAALRPWAPWPVAAVVAVVAYTALLQLLRVNGREGLRSLFARPEAHVPTQAPSTTDSGMPLLP
ncbi:MAG: hypothetical protein QOE84_3048 [Actinomycetota bacterium]|nr:hypothetical protein [Actinomycetota bacterium]